MPRIRFMTYSIFYAHLLVSLPSPPHHHRRTSSSARPIQPQQTIPQNNYDTSHVAAALAHSCKRSSSRDRPAPRARGPYPSRPHRRSSTRSHHRHNPHPDMAPSATAAAAAGNGTGSPAAPKRQQHGYADAPPRASTSKHARSRTIIPTQSGKWILGKTIGAGSMGKVKLARKEDGSEQVRLRFVVVVHLPPPISHLTSLHTASPCAQS
ncbi:hypothetical protein BGZ61DRAFT_205155 [Ilyonectria robusta]|uniref:uncharacterized protein n=1 Tax=Ilyonectria robusta TaxID=1079257 RepID=UPI001E8D471A|nr:uncharacterized protein BGZ61DRAFT_205155 [Ilyonectria robusta]KAH8654217.1 hypothetical protein BGZ61DRAFT_205155 [Ilyonectria robusta]